MCVVILVMPIRWNKQNNKIIENFKRERKKYTENFIIFLLNPLDMQNKLFNL